MRPIRHITNRNVHDERGASLVEYALLITLIAILALAAVDRFGGNTSSKLDYANSELSMT